ncbi:MAG: ABC transporter ATP-binding protein/permease [Armatimonadetes bacterium]|nr:ABC transporter ATP-binding protein/permease [Armatimonadota bacterium]
MTNPINPSLLDPDQTTASSDILIQLEADLDANFDYGHQTLEVTSGVVRILEKGGVEVLRIPMTEIASARNEPLVGGGRLELTTKLGEIIPIISYTHTLGAKFSEAARGIEQLAQGKELLVNLKRELTRCIKCGRLLPEADGVCPACVDRGKTLIRILRFVAPYKKQAIFLTVLSFCTTLMNLTPPYIQGRLIREVFEKKTNLPLLWQLIGVWILIAILGTVVNITRDRLTAWLSGNVAADLRSTVYRAIEFLQLTFFDKKQVGAIASRVTSDTDRVWGFLVEGVPYFLLNGLTLIGVVGVLIFINPLMAAVILAPVPIVTFIGVAFWKGQSQLFHRVGQKWARFHNHLNESLHGIRVVKAFAKEDGEFTKFQQRNHELRNAGVHADARWFTIFGGMIFFTTVGTVLCWAMGGYLVASGKLALSEFWMMQAYLSLVYGPLQWFAAVNNWFSRAMAGAERIFEVTDMEPESYGDRAKRIDITGEVEFDHVRFGYDKSNPVLKDICFTAKPGEMIGLVGKSGAGKSTTINLIGRFYEPDAGLIKVDGVNYKDIPLQDLREQIGIVLQEPFLFNGTIAENISYGKPGASFEDIVAASRAANAHDFIIGKADGYDSMVGERGAKLSGGERQRVSIARAILHNPRILILDEATSSVDIETEKKIQEAIQRLVAGRTTFAIAHRLSTLKNADRLIVLDRGEIAEMGTHEELMDKKGVFYKLVQTQTAINEIIELGTINA